VSQTTSGDAPIPSGTGSLPPDSIYYFAGYWGYLGIEFDRPTLLLVPRSGDCSLITPLMESDKGRLMTWVTDVRTWEDGAGSECRAPLEALLDGGITVAGKYGTRVGDSIVVTESGFDYLTPYPKALRIL